MNQLIPFPKRSLDSCETVAEVKNFLADIAAMVAWAKAQDDPHVEAAAIEWKMRAERKLGQLMAAQKAAGLMAPPPGLNQYSREEDRVFKKPEAPATLLEAGIDKNLAHRAREAAALPEAEFEDKIAERRDEIINKPISLEPGPVRRRAGQETQSRCHCPARSRLRFYDPCWPSIPL